MPSKVKRKWIARPSWHLVVTRGDGSRWIVLSSWNRETAERMIEHFQQLEDCVRVEVESDRHDSDGRTA